MAEATFHQLWVTNPDGPDKIPLKLTFTDRELAGRVDTELFLKGYDVERAFGYKLFTDLEEALHSVEIFCGKREKRRYAR